MYVRVSVAMWMGSTKATQTHCTSHYSTLASSNLLRLFTCPDVDRLAIFAIMICTNCSPLLTALLCHYTCTKEAVPMYMYI